MDKVVARGSSSGILRRLIAMSGTFANGFLDDGNMFASSLGVRSWAHIHSILTGVSCLQVFRNLAEPRTPTQDRGSLILSIVLVPLREPLPTQTFIAVTRLSFGSNTTSPLPGWRMPDCRELRDAKRGNDGRPKMVKYDHGANEQAAVTGTNRQLGLPRRFLRKKCESSLHWMGLHTFSHVPLSEALLRRPYLSAFQRSVVPHGHDVAPH